MYIYIYLIIYIYALYVKISTIIFFCAKSQMFHDEVPNFFGIQGSAEACQVHQAPVAKAADLRDCCCQ